MLKMIFSKLGIERNARKGGFSFKKEISLLFSSLPTPSQPIFSSLLSLSSSSNLKENGREYKFSPIKRFQLAYMSFYFLSLPTFPSFGFLEYAYKGQWYNPVEWIALTIESLHYNLDISYPSTIVLYTLIMRTILLPLQFNQIKTTYRQTIYKPIVQANTNQIMRLREGGQSIEALKKLQEAREFLKEKKITPFKTLALAIIPIPIYISTFLSLRNMSYQPISSMIQEGGLGWITNIASSDPYFILPAITTGLMMATMEVFSCFYNYLHFVILFFILDYTDCDYHETETKNVF